MKENTLLELIIGTKDHNFFIASCLFALLGIILRLSYNYLNRKNKNDSVFSLKYLLTDNAIRILVGIISVFVCMRFSVEFLGSEITLALSFVIGLSIDKLSKIIQNRILKS